MNSPLPKEELLQKNSLASFVMNRVFTMTYRVFLISSSVTSSNQFISCDSYNNLRFKQACIVLDSLAEKVMSLSAETTYSMIMS